MSTPRKPDTRAFFRSQILRLASTRFFPSLDEGVKELIDCLMRISRSDAARAQRIIDRALAKYQECPTVADLVAIAAEMEPPELPPGCDECDGTGWRQIIKRGYEFREHCVCLRGQRLRQSEAERKRIEKPQAKEAHT